MNKEKFQIIVDEIYYDEHYKQYLSSFLGVAIEENLETLHNNYTGYHYSIYRIYLSNACYVLLRSPFYFFRNDAIREASNMAINLGLSYSLSERKISNKEEKDDENLAQQLTI